MLRKGADKVKCLCFAMLKSLLIPGQGKNSMRLVVVKVNAGLYLSE